jgi:hypothetical protein
MIFRTKLKMNKSELIDTIADNYGISKADAKKELDATISAITNELVAGNSVVLTGFCSFVVNVKSGILAGFLRKLIYFGKKPSKCIEESIMIALQELAETPKLERSFKLLQVKTQHLKQARHSVFCNVD